MSEQTNTAQEQQVPSKEDLIKFFQEQIDVKKVQVELQELNTKLAVARAEELKALSFIGNMTNPQQQPTQKHIVTQEDLDANPELIEAGVNVGDEVLIPVQEEVLNPPTSESKRKLKKDQA
jgi:hypothetical protein